MITPQSAGAPAADRRPYVMLGVAAVGFAITFWAWALLSPLGAYFKQARPWAPPRARCSPWWRSAPRPSKSAR